MLRSYPITCTHRGCSHPALYKIAARWSDGTTGELKTYSLCCAGCLAESYRLSCEKQKACRTARGETLETPGIYLLAQGKRDRTLQRQPDLEKRLAPPSS
jgi:hypothetical protein